MPDKKLEQSETHDQIRTFSESEFLELIAHADSLMRFDKRMEDRELTKEALKTSSSDNQIPLSTLYEAAKDVDIPFRYIDRALSIRSLSLEEQIKDIGRYGVIPSVVGAAKTYRNSLLGALKSSFPENNFLATELLGGEHHPDIYFLEVTEKEEVKRSLRSFFRERSFLVEYEESLAHLEFTSEIGGFAPKGKFNLDILVKKPKFLHACGNTLKKLSEEFLEVTKDYRLRYNYSVK